MLLRGSARIYLGMCRVKKSFGALYMLVLCLSMVVVVLCTVIVTRISCAVSDESPSLKHDGPGLLSMPLADRDTLGSQFIITFEADNQLDRFVYLLVIRVIHGLKIGISIQSIYPLWYV